MINLRKMLKEEVERGQMLQCDTLEVKKFGKAGVEEFGARGVILMHFAGSAMFHFLDDETLGTLLEAITEVAKDE